MFVNKAWKKNMNACIKNQYNYLCFDLDTSQLAAG
jgi:hypothetical protein